MTAEDHRSDDGGERAGDDRPGHGVDAEAPGVDRDRGTPRWVLAFVVVALLVLLVVGLLLAAGHGPGVHAP